VLFVLKEGQLITAIIHGGMNVGREAIRAAFRISKECNSIADFQ
jgi:hypothetical protein